MEEERVVDTASRSPLLPPRLNYFLLFPDDFNAQLWINMSRRNEELSRPTLRGSRNVAAQEKRFQPSQS